MKHSYDMFDMGEERKVIYPKKKKAKKHSSKPSSGKHASDPVDSKKSKKSKKAWLSYRLWIKKEDVTQKMLDAYTDVIPDALPETDEFGEPIEDRNLYVEGYRYHKKLRLYSFARGDVEKMHSIFKKFDIEDCTAAPDLRHRIKFLGVLVKGELLPLRPDQKAPIKEILEKRYGILEAQPRFGKTTCMTKIVTKLGLRTIVFVHQVDLARQFEQEFRNDTNVNALERKYGRKIIGLARKWDDVKNLDVAIVTWQKFHAGKGGAKAIKRFRDSFGLTLVDEGHRFSSQFSSKVVGAFNTRYRVAVTATPERKDKRDVVFKQIVGPVTAIGKTKQVPMRVHPVYTGFAPKFGSFMSYTKKCSQSASRNKLCLRQVVAEANAGHFVLVVTTLKKHIFDLCERLKKKGIRVEAFYGGVRGRDDVLRRAKSGQAQVIVGMRSMLTGVNVPRWDRMHILMPTSNGPNHYQEFSRVRTVFEGKPYCVVHHYIDNCGAGRGCYGTCHSNYLNPKYAPIAFVDDNGNIIKTPSFSSIEQRSKEAVLKGARGNIAADSGNAQKRINAVWGWSGGVKVKRVARKKKNTAS